MWPSSLADGAFEVYGTRGGTADGQHHRGFDENTEGKEVGQMRWSTPLHSGGVVERRWRSVEVGGKSEEGQVHQGSAHQADKAPRGTASGGGIGRDPISFLCLPPPTSPPQCIAVLTRCTSRFLISVRRHIFMCCGVDPMHGTSTDLEWASVRSKMCL